MISQLVSGLAASLNAGEGLDIEGGTRGGSSVGVIPANPQKRMTPQHMVWIQTACCRVYVAFFLTQIKALRVDDMKGCADF